MLGRTFAIALGAVLTGAAAAPTVTVQAGRIPEASSNLSPEASPPQIAPEPFTARAARELSPEELIRRTLLEYAERLSLAGGLRGDAILASAGPISGGQLRSLSFVDRPRNVPGHPGICSRDVVNALYKRRSAPTTGARPVSPDDPIEVDKVGVSTLYQALERVDPADRWSPETGAKWSVRCSGEVEGRFFSSTSPATAWTLTQVFSQLLERHPSARSPFNIAMDKIESLWELPCAQDLTKTCYHAQFSNGDWSLVFAVGGTYPSLTVSESTLERVHGPVP